MSQYNPQKIEAKWQRIWRENTWSRAKDGVKKPKFYCLVEFPYPSGTGLHVGHLRSYSALDAVARYKRMNGFNVLYPMGWDAFGLPAENYAIKTGIQPQITTRQNIANYKKQMQKMGLSFDWSREVNTTDPKYYKWTQWIFLQLFRKGLAYQKEMPVNWCPSCKIGLANEEVIAGKCERCGAVTEKKNLKQWMLKITAYADRLLGDLDLVDYSPRIREQQINWIGRSEGASIKFQISNNKLQINSKIQISNDEKHFLEVFTTRPDTIFGATYVVVCPEHSIVQNSKLKVRNYDEVQKYIKNAAAKSDLERTDLAKEKTGIKLEGVVAINPANNKEIPIFVADYVLPHYGTGAIMAVPAHDQRDFEFARKYDLSIVQTTVLNSADYQRTIETLKFLQEVRQIADKADIEIFVFGGLVCAFHAGVIYRKHDDLDIVAKNQADFEKLKNVFLQVGFKPFKEKNDEHWQSICFGTPQKIDLELGLMKDIFGLTESEVFDSDMKSLVSYQALTVSVKLMKKFKQNQLGQRNLNKDKTDLEFLNGRMITEDGFAINSSQFNGLSTSEFKKQIIHWLVKNKTGKKAINYKLRDWVFSRQHYWGEPMPLVFCENCAAKIKHPACASSLSLRASAGRQKSNLKNKNLSKFSIGELTNPGWIAVLEKDLPVKLPRLEKYQPTGTGESPLASATKWVNTKCPKCGGPAKRETDTMPNWAGSSWYFLRYCDAHNDKKLADPKKLKYWLPVDLYNGGMEHTTLHLLYSRFWHKFLYDLGVVPTCEPYAKRRSHGVVLAQDAQKMSKSRGNIVNPDEMIKTYGADSLRVYEMFMGPFSQMIPWSTQGLVGVRRFLERVWDYTNETIKFLQNLSINPDFKNTHFEAKVELHKLIKKTNDDIDKFKFNTIISELMKFINLTRDVDPRSIGEKIYVGYGYTPLSKNDLGIFLKTLAPFAPHISEELWQQLGHKKSIFLEKWPQYDPKLIRQSTFDLVVQINGKLRDRVKAEIGITQQEAEKLAMASNKVKQFLADKQIRKVIFVKDKLINLVIVG